MSYILDALRKSDQQRQRGAAPTLLLGQATAVPKQPALLSYGLLALVLLGPGIAIGWLRPWQPEPAAPAPVAIAAKPPEPGQSQPPAVRPDMAPKPEPELHAQNSAPATQAVPAPAPALAQPHGAAGVKVETQSAPPKAVAEVSKKAAAPAPVPEQALSTSSGTADAAPAQNVISLAELPLSLQQELPPMTISVHAYSGRPGDRLVGINNRMLREGDYVVPGLKLEQITPEGMVFGYKGYSFRRGVK